MKVLLIQLYSGTECKPVYPIGLSYLSTALTSHEVRILDQNLCGGDPFLETEKLISVFSPEVIGISIRNIHIYSTEKGYFNPDKPLSLTIDAVKKISDNIIIAAGGPGFSMFPIHFMQNEPGINFGVFLEGEESFPELLKNLDSPEKVKGVYWKNKDEVLYTGRYAPPDFAALPKPHRDFINPQKYKGEYAIGVQSKRGCMLSCIYCAYLFLSGKTLRLRPAEKVADEIENLINNYGINEFTFVDHVFNVPKAHAEEICNEIIKRGLHVQWSAWFNEKFMDENFVDLAIRAGCRFFEFSPDGYSNRSLKWLKKNIQTKDIINTYHLLRQKNQIKIGYNFMLGIPGQNIFSLLRQAIFFLKLKVFLGKRLKLLTFNKLGIDPNTDLEKIAISEGVITQGTDLFKPTFYEVGIIGWIKKHRGFTSVLKLLKTKTFVKSAESDGQ
ncbi:MAG: radical SAM protein [Nitrospirae bacterium]|nr:radical SAM protein [Nitrospirota bacterium]